MRCKLLCLWLLMLSLVPATVQGRGLTWDDGLINGWVDLDYIVAWRKSRDIPPLVTTSPLVTSDLIAGILGLPTTSIVFGDDTFDHSPRSGVTGDFGIWTSPCFAIGGGFFTAIDEKKSFGITSDAAGDPILARPFFDVDLGIQQAFLVSYPGLFFDSFIDIKLQNSVWGADAYGCIRAYTGDYITINVLGGYFFSRIKDSLDVFEEETIDAFGDPVQSFIDSFHTRNSYNAGMLGCYFEWFDGDHWGVTCVGKLAVGNMRSTVNIQGFNELLGVVSTGGTLATDSNIGSYPFNRTAVVPKLDLHLRYSLNSRITLEAGYMFVYWPAIALAADQVSLFIDPTGIQPFPAFELKRTDFWLQGATVGFHLKW